MVVVVPSLWDWGGAGAGTGSSRVLRSVERSQNIVSPAFTALCGSGNSPPPPPTVVIIFVYSTWRVFVGCVGVIPPPASLWELQVLETANTEQSPPLHGGLSVETSHRMANC